MVVANQGCCQKHGGGAEESHGVERNIKMERTFLGQVSTPVKLVVIVKLKLVTRVWKLSSIVRAVCFSI
jgi:hypothetical protein